MGQYIDTIHLSWAKQLKTGLLLFLIAIILVQLWNLTLPTILFTQGYSPIIEDQNGQIIDARIAPDQQWRFPPDHHIPERFIQALVLFEDKRFFAHMGIDPLALNRALWDNLWAGKITSGASTITMQLARLQKNSSTRTLGDKFSEALLALRLELAYSKEQIIGLYAAHAPFGGNVVGLEAAAWRYFGRAPENLSWGETAMLAVLPNSPSLVHLGRNRETLQQKRNALLQQLYLTGAFDIDTLALAQAEPLPGMPQALPSNAQHLAVSLMQELNSNPNALRLLQQRFKTSLDGNIQIGVNNLVSRHQERLAGNGIYNAAVLVLRQNQHNVAAYVGNVASLNQSDPQGLFGGQNDMILARRSTGSLLKPFLYAAMLDSGDLAPQQLVADIPTRYGSYSPENYNVAYMGAVPADEALSRSLNIPAARELRIYGLDRFYNLLNDLGMSTLFRPASEYGLTLILGGAESNLWEMTNLYADFGDRLGLEHKSAALNAKNPWPLFQLANANSDGIGRGRDSSYPLSPAAVWTTLRALVKVNRPEQEAAWQLFASRRNIAWKTGTSFGHRDAWAIGMDGSWVVGVWVGNAGNIGRPDLRGTAAAAPLLFDVFGLLEDGTWFTEPSSGFVKATICSSSGHPAGPDCQNTEEQSVPLGTLQARPCPYCRIVHLEPDSNYRANPLVTNPLDMQATKRFILPPAMEYWYRPNHPDYQGMPAYRPGGQLNATGQNRLALLSPQNGARFYVPIELDGNLGATIFQAVHSEPSAVLFWHLDDDYIGNTTYPHRLEIRPHQGKHRLLLSDEAGNQVLVNFEVLSR